MMQNSKNQKYKHEVM